MAEKSEANPKQGELFDEESSEEKHHLDVVIDGLKAALGEDNVEVAAGVVMGSLKGVSEIVLFVEEDLDKRVRSGDSEDARMFDALLSVALVGVLAKKFEHGYLKRLTELARCADEDARKMLTAIDAIIQELPNSNK